MLDLAFFQRHLDVIFFKKLIYALKYLRDIDLICLF